MSQLNNARFFAGSLDYHRRCGRPTVVTIGNFDGVHVGHQALLQRTVERATQLNALSCVYTFEPSPRSLLAPQLATPRISSWDDKVTRLFDLGIDCVVIERFSKAFAQHPPAWFAQHIIAQRLSALGLVVGYDFRFGRARAGTCETLRDLLPELSVEQIAPLTLPRAVEATGDCEEIIVSSSRIRELVAVGEVSTASQLLGRSYRLSGVVVGGDKRGRRMGYPTANIETAADLVPSPGVYAVNVELDSGTFGGMLNLGTRPTFGGRKSTIEVHILDFDQDIYGAAIVIEFVARVRSERRFKDSTELRRQLDLDQQIIRTLLAAPEQGNV